MNSAQNGSSGYSPKSPIVLQKGSAARQEHNAKHSLKCDEYSMKQNPNFKKKFHLRSVHELFHQQVSQHEAAFTPKHSSSKAYSSSSLWLL